jgi:Holliday junction resolvasome RuvABC DNA-binding subunit
MATPKKNQFSLDQASLDRIKQNQTTLQEARSKVEALKKLGMDMKEIEDRLNWAEEASKTLLKEFAP